MDLRRVGRRFHCAVLSSWGRLNPVKVHSVLQLHRWSPMLLMEMCWRSAVMFTAESVPQRRNSNWPWAVSLHISYAKAVVYDAQVCALLLNMRGNFVSGRSANSCCITPVRLQRNLFCCWGKPPHSAQLIVHFSFHTRRSGSNPAGWTKNQPLVPLRWMILQTWVVSAHS